MERKLNANNLQQGFFIDTFAHGKVAIGDKKTGNKNHTPEKGDTTRARGIGFASVAW